MDAFEGEEFTFASAFNALREFRLKPSLEGRPPGILPFDAFGRSRRLDRQYKNEYFVALLGDGGVGSKSALIIQFCSNHFVSEYDPTIEDSYTKTFELDGDTVVGHFLDTAGQEEFSALRDQWIRNSEAFLVGYSVTSRDSFNSVPLFFDHIRRIHSYSGISPTIILVGNKVDLVDERQVSTEEGQNFADANGIQFFETSAKTAYNVHECIHEICRLSARKRKLEMPPLFLLMEMIGWRAPVSLVKQVLEQLSPATILNEPLSRLSHWAQNLVMFTAVCGSVQCMKMICQSFGEELEAATLNTALFGAVGSSRLSMLEQVLEAGADPNCFDIEYRTPLHYAVEVGSYSIIKALLNAGADVNGRPSLRADKMSPIHLACMRGNIYAELLLLRKGAHYRTPYVDDSELVFWNPPSTELKDLMFESVPSVGQRSVEWDDEDTLSVEQYMTSACVLPLKLLSLLSVLDTLPSKEHNVGVLRNRFPQDLFDTYVNPIIRCLSALPDDDDEDTVAAQWNSRYRNFCLKSYFQMQKLSRRKKSRKSVKYSCLPFLRR